jgi:hypothetical protein
MTYTLPYLYNVYGIALHSEISLPLPTRGREELAHIALRTQPASFFAGAIEGIPLEQADGSCYQIGRLPDGSCYARWQAVGEFLVSANGLQIYSRQFDETHKESFQVYMLGQALSFALVKRGLEPIHATVLAIHGEAVVFLGDSGFGKSTLAASFISAGHPVLTDDLLMLHITDDGILAYPGPPRIKLFPEIARRFLGEMATGVPMNRDTERVIIPLNANQSCSVPLPVRAIYSLSAPRDVFRKQPIRIKPLSPRAGLTELVKNTFNRSLVDSDRLTRQLEQTSRLATLLPVRELSIPRDLDRLTEVQQAILSDLALGAVSEPAELASAD